MSNELALVNPANQYQVAALDPDRIMKLMQVADCLSKGGMYSALKNPAQYFSVIQYGAELGFGPMASLQNISIIGGKPACDAKFLLAMMKKAGWSYQITESTTLKCKIEFKKGECTHPEEYTMEEAKIAKLADKESWKKYPKDMLFNRCVSRASRRLASETTLGIYTTEEIEETSHIGAEQAKNITPAQEIQPEPESQQQQIIEPEQESKPDDDTAKLGEAAKKLHKWCQENLSPQLPRINEMLMDAGLEQLTCLPHLYNAFALFWNDPELKKTCFDPNGTFDWDLCLGSFVQWRVTKKENETKESKKESALPESIEARREFFETVDKYYDRIKEGLRTAGIEEDIDPGKLDDYIEAWLEGKITEDTKAYLVNKPDLFIQCLAKDIKKRNVEKITSQIPPG